MKKLFFAALAAAMLIASPALATRRVCEAVLRGPAGEHVIQILMEDEQRVAGWAIWKPPLEGPQRALPGLHLHYRLTDLNTGARSPLLYAEVFHIARISDSRASTATVGIGPYGGEELERRDWTSFAQSRARAERDDIDALAGGTGFSSRQVLDLVQNAPQIRSAAITDRNEMISEGVWNLTTRVALDPLFARAFSVASAHAENPRRHCRAPNYMDSPMIWDYERRTGASSE